MIGITNEDNESQIKAFVKKMGNQMNYLVAIDAEGSLTNDFMGRYHITGIPHAFVLGRDDKVLWNGHPADPALEKEIQRALGQPKAKERYTDEEVATMSVKELKGALTLHNINFNDCVEKSDLQKRLLDHRRA